MTFFTRYLKQRFGKTLLFKHLKYVGALMGRTTYPLPFHTVVDVAPYLERATRRLGARANNDTFYSYFSEIWRDGYQESLVKHYELYLSHVPKGPCKEFLDVGCGAGEFLEFLGHHGISARGIDINLNEVQRSAARGLRVELADATTYLKETRVRFAGISMLEVIEHLEPDVLDNLLTCAFDALEPNGVLILETVNPKHVQAFNSFYVDPTHTRPIPSELLSFMVQWHGFIDAKLVYMSPMAYSHEQSLDASRAYVHYAVLARKP